MGKINLSNRKIIIFILFFIITFYTIVLITLFYVHNNDISESLIQYEGMWSIVIFILIRIGLTIILSILIYQRWTNQENNYLFEISYLFLLFFLGLIFGKFIDLLYKLIYFTADDFQKLFILKLRYFLIILTAAPFIYLGLKTILSSNSLIKHEIKGFKSNKKVIIIIILLLISIQFFFILAAPDLKTAYMSLTIIHILSLTWISFSFLYIYKKKLIPDINAILISVAFSLDLALFIISTITTPLRQKIVGFSPLYVISSEVIDLIIIFMIFIGYYFKIKTNV